MNMPILVYPPNEQIIAELQLAQQVKELAPLYESYLNFAFGLQQRQSLEEQLCLSTAVIRFVSAFLTAENADFTKINLHQVAQELGIDSNVVKVRNECAHGSLPPLGVLREVSLECLQYLTAKYQITSKHVNNAFDVFYNAMLYYKNCDEFIKICDTVDSTAIIEEILSRIFLLLPEEEFEAIKNASASFLDDSPESMIKRGLQLVYARCKMPILAFLFNEKIEGMEKIEKEATIQYINIEECFKYKAIDFEVEKQEGNIDNTKMLTREEVLQQYYEIE